MTYEELIALQERIGYVSKGLTLDRIKSFPKMKRKEINTYLNMKQEKSAASNNKRLKSSSVSQLEIDVRNPLEESKHSSRVGLRMGEMNEDISEELIDGDEGIINRKLPTNAKNFSILRINGATSKRQNKDEDEGWENCNEEDEERKDIEMIDQSLKRVVSKGNNQVDFNNNEAMEELKQSQILSQNST